MAIQTILGAATAPSIPEGAGDLAVKPETNDLASKLPLLNAAPIVAFDAATALATASTPIRSRAASTPAVLQCNFDDIKSACFTPEQVSAITEKSA